MPTADQDAFRLDAADGRWFAVNTRPHAELQAEVNLERQGWRCYCPRIFRPTRSGRRITHKLYPLFPGYLFVFLDPSRARWRAVDSTIGVRGIIKSGDEPVPLPRGVVETFISLTDRDGRLTLAPVLTPGGTVRFSSGPFVGLLGRLEHLGPAGRITVLLDLLGRETPVSGLAEEVVPAFGA